MTPVTVDYAPRRYFVPFHERTQTFACIVAHRRAGKTTACIHELQKAATSLQKVRPRFAYIAPQLKQAKSIAWDILKAAARPLQSHGATINESELRVDYPNGGQVRIYGADNPDALRGIGLDGCVIDEPADIDPRLWPEVISPTLADREGWVAFIGTPKGRDAFYGIWRNAQKDPNWLALHLPASKTKVLSASRLEIERANKSASQYAREYECSFDEPDVQQFISSDIVDAARNRKSVATGPKVLGVDVARFGDDRTVVLFRNGDVIEREWIRTWRGLDLMQTSAMVAEAINDWKPQTTFVDGVGVGGGVVDRLRQMQFNVIDVNAGGKASHDTRFLNLRAEMWSRMRDWLKERGDIPAERDDLADDLTAPLYEFDLRGRLQLEKKADMKDRGLPSPDLADALALTFARLMPAAPELMVKWGSTTAPVEDPLAEF